MFNLIRIDKNKKINQVENSFDFSSHTIKLSKKLYGIIEKESFSIIDQLFSKKEMIAAIKKRTPENMLIGNQGQKPHFLSLDFALTMDRDCPIKLIELQGFPSVLAISMFLSEQTAAIGYCPSQNEVNRSYLRDTLIGNENLVNVVMLDINPKDQGTYADFILTEKYFGIKYVCLDEIFFKDGSYYYNHNNEDILIKRIYNRIIESDLNPEQSIFFREIILDNNIFISGHPDWFSLISKSSLPLLSGDSILKCKPFNGKKEISKNSVIKPIHNFGGKGVIINSDKNNVNLYLLKDHIEQEKAEYFPVKINNKTHLFYELRVNLVWPDNHNSPFIFSILTRSNDELPIGMSNIKNKPDSGLFSVLLESK